MGHCHCFGTPSDSRRTLPVDGSAARLSHSIQVTSKRTGSILREGLRPSKLMRDTQGLSKHALICSQAFPLHPSGWGLPPGAQDRFEPTCRVSCIVCILHIPFNKKISYNIKI